MQYYQEMSLKSVMEVGNYFLWQQLFRKLHLLLVKHKSAQGNSLVGIAFPGYLTTPPTLGEQLRLFATTESALQTLAIEEVFQCMQDYLFIDPIRQVPASVKGYCVFKPHKPKGSMEKLARRRAKRKQESYDEALKHYATYQQRLSTLPYIKTISHSSSQSFSLFIEQQMMDTEAIGPFSCYGLSATSTVPVF